MRPQSDTPRQMPASGAQVANAGIARAASVPVILLWAGLQDDGRRQLRGHWRRRRLDDDGRRRLDDDGRLRFHAMKNWGA